MRNLSEANLTDAVLATFANTPDPRLREILGSLVRHLHAFVREVNLTEAEWMAGIQFLTATGQMCDDKRQEFILLSDTLGVTTLKDLINHRQPPGVTEYTILGPFYREGARELPALSNIAVSGTPGEPTIVSGRVLDAQGNPIAGALLDVWQASGEGFYDVQLPGQDMNLRGKFRTDSEGRYIFRTVRPSSYPIPHDGPVGRMLRATGRHPYRPAHIHFIVSADGFKSITTELFADDDEYLDSDAVFGVRSSLVVPFVRHESPAEAEKLGVTAPFYTVHYDFVLERE
ncbi:MAG: intradiol ring-cleavage dioxygenase [Anaerolineales bacterium]|nr:intradiol ring-cleavage dioxygenase [Anaerolineales bacterium]